MRVLWVLQLDLYFTSWRSPIRQITENFEIIVIKRRIDVVYDVGLSPRVTLFKRHAVVHHVLVVVFDGGLAVRARKRRFATSFIVGIAQVWRVVEWRLRRRDSAVYREFVGRVHHSAMPFRVRLNRLGQRQKFFGQLGTRFHWCIFIIFWQKFSKLVFLLLFFSQFFYSNCTGCCSACSTSRFKALRGFLPLPLSPITSSLSLSPFYFTHHLLSHRLQLSHFQRQERKWESWMFLCAGRKPSRDNKS